MKGKNDKNNKSKNQEKIAIHKKMKQKIIKEENK